MRVDCRHEPACLKYHALSRWAGMHLGKVEHERRVASIASTLFDLTSSLHALDGSDLRLLRMAALVHDVGRSVDDETHPQEGARLIRDAVELPLTGGERRWLSYLTRYHKGRVPALRTDGILRRKDDQEKLLLILAFLRAADALDSRCSNDPPRLRFAMNGWRIRIDCQFRQDTSSKVARALAKRKKFRLLEDLLGCRVDVKLSYTKAAQLVA